jgi:predicted membrane protein
MEDPKRIRERAPEDSPSGEERQVNPYRAANIDGAPLAYVVSLAAVIAVLAMVPIPISIVIGSGRNFPMSQSIYGLVGWLLGPVAGALANGIGAVIGVIVAPYTTSSAFATIFGAAMGGLVAGATVLSGPRRTWWMPLGIVLVSLYGVYGGRAIFANRAPWLNVLLGSFINWSAILLFILPTRRWIARLLKADDLKQLGIGLFAGTWMVAGLAHLSTAAIVYAIQNWPAELWLVFAPMAPIEHTIRCLAGTAIGLGVIRGLRATGIVKAEHAIY